MHKEVAGTLLCCSRNPFISQQRPLHVRLCSTGRGGRTGTVRRGLMEERLVERIAVL